MDSGCEEREGSRMIPGFGWGSQVAGAATKVPTAKEGRDRSGMGDKNSLGRLG